MTNRRTRRSAARPNCALCGAIVPDTRPVYLVTAPDGRILGPYHPECAARARSADPRRTETVRTPEGYQYGMWPSQAEGGTE